MLERLLVPLDGSPQAEGIVPHVRSLVGPGKASATLLQACVEEGRARAQDYLEDLAARHRSESWSLRTRVADGTPAESILEVARLERASLIAMTVRRGFLGGSLGTVAPKVIRASRVPVLLANPGAKGAAPRKILFPLAGEESQEACRPVIELARRFGAEVHVVHVTAPPDLPMGLAAAPSPPPPRAGEILGPMAWALDVAGVDVRTRVWKGDPASVLLNQASSSGVDLVVMATRGPSALSRWAFGGVIGKVFRGLRVPLLVVPARPVSTASVA